MSKSQSNDPAVITEEIIAANGQTAKIVSVQDHAGNELFGVDKDGDVEFVSESGKKGAYSYIIWKSGTTYYAMNGATRKIDYSGDDCSTVIQSVCTALATTGGRILMRDSTFEILTTVTYAGGIYFEGQAAILDLRGIDTVAFDCNVSGYVYYKYTGFAGFRVLGLGSNVNTMFVRMTHIIWSLIFRDLIIESVNNPMQLGGANFLATVENCQFLTFGGIGINMPDSWNNGMLIQHCTFEPAGAGPHGWGIRISDTDIGDCPEEIKIVGCWFEQVAGCVYTEGLHTIIDHCRMSTAAGDLGGYVVHACKAGHSNSNGMNTDISHCYIRHSGTATSAIYLEGQYQEATIIGNVFYACVSTEIEATSDCYIHIVGNTFDSNADISHIKGPFSYSQIIGNIISGHSGTRGTGIAITNSSAYVYQEIVGNSFYFLENGITGARRGTIVGNSFVSISTILIQATYCAISANYFGTTGTLSLTGCKVVGNYGYVTDNHGTSTGTGSQQTIAHGLSAAPTMVLLSEGTTGGALAYQSAAADATNIYITATLNMTYAWRVEV
jgi:hypothetical protein